jgi:hypothetical protein
MNCPFPPRGQNLHPTWREGELCVPDPFGDDPCGEAACCHLTPNPNNPAVFDEVCNNRTKNQCAAEVPIDAARLWQLGQYCGLTAQECPRNACLARDGSCYVAHGGPGCSDPFCCSDICELGATGAFCCNTSWDSACVALAEQYCERAPGNDQCAPDFPVRGLEGALAIPFPGSRATSNVEATESFSDPGFCCHNGVGSCVGGFADGESCVVDDDCPDAPGDPATCTERTPDPGATGLGSIWFKWVQGSGTSAGISTCTSNSPALDSILQIFEPNDLTSPLTECNSLSVIGCNDDAANCSSTQRNSRVCMRNLTPGKTYYVLLSSKIEARRGQYIVSISTSCSGPNNDPILNDYCRNATPITDPTPADPLVVQYVTGRFCLGGSNAGQPCTSNTNCPGGGTCPTAGATYDCPAESCSPAARNDVWFNYTATCSGDAEFSTCGGANPDTSIAVYEGCTTCPTTSNTSSSLCCNADNNQAGCVQPGRCIAPVVQGQCYKVRVSDNGLPMSGNLTITCSGFPDCNSNGISDEDEIANCPPGTGPAGCQDCNGNGKPDECDIPPDTDCNSNGIPDLCELDGNDCQPNGIPDDCDGGCPGCLGFVSSTPDNCSLDARRPHPPNLPNNPENWNSLTMSFSSECEATPAEFSVTCSPNAAPCPTVANVVAAGSVQTITLSDRIPAGNWTCVTYNPTGNEVCLGSLPGDCSGNLTTAPADILDLINHLNGVRNPPLTIELCDLDRSNSCAAADIIPLIDLLNGVTGYAVWNGASLPSCPNPPPP